MMVIFEVTLFKTPKNPVELNELIGAVVMRQINSEQNILLQEW